MKYLVISLFLLSPIAMAKTVPNTKVVETYNKQLNETKRIFNETQNTLIQSDAVFDMYQKLGSVTPEVVAVSRHLITLGEDAKALYGDDLILAPTPFNACATLPAVAYSFWMAKLSSVNNNDMDAVNTQGQSYITQGKACVNEIKNPPPSHIEENEKLEIIDVTQ